LNSIIIEGNLIFEDKDDNSLLSLDAHYIMVNKGKLVVGSSKYPMKRPTIITLHGSKIERQLPIYGNKVLFVRDG
jgi:hypothetical protein